MVAGYARQAAVGPAVAAVRRFHAAGGSPDAQMLDLLANVAIRAGDYKVAMQVGGRAGRKSRGTGGFGGRPGGARSRGPCNRRTRVCQAHR